MKLIDKSAVVAEIEKLISNGKLKCQQSQENNDRESYIAWSEHIATCGKILSFLNTLEVIDPYEQCIQYASIESGIKAHSEIYSFNIESELFNQLTKEQQTLWRKEIEQAYISGGYTGYQLAKDLRYKENLEAKEVDLEKEIDGYICNNFFGSQTLGLFASRTKEEPNYYDIALCARYFFELGMSVSNKAQKGK